MSLFFSTRAAVMVSALLAGALAHAGPRLALHPLVDLSVERGLDPAAANQIEFRTLAKMAGIDLVDPAAVATFLKARPKGCEGEGEALDACLGALAKAAHAPAALLVRVYPYAGHQVVLSWTVVDDSGLELAARRLQVEKQGNTKRGWVRAALKNFFENTDLDPVKLRAALPKAVVQPPETPVKVASTPPVKTTPATLIPKAPPPEQPTQSRPKWRRPVAIGLAAVGAVGLGAGWWLGSRSRADADSYRSLLERGQTAAQRDLLADLRDGSNRKAHMANLALAGGGALLAAGAALFAVDLLSGAPSSEVAVSIGPSPGGIWVAGALP